MESRYNRTEATDRYGRIKTIGMSALAVGAGASLLYKNGGAQLANEAVGRLSKSLKASQRTLASKTFKESFGNGKALMRQSKDAFKKAYNDYDLSVKLRPNKTSTFTNAVVEYSKLSSSSKLTSKVINANIQGQLKKQLRTAEILKDIDSRRIDHIVDSAFTHITKTANVVKQDGDRTSYIFSNKFKEEYMNDKYFNKDQQEFIENLISENLKVKKEQMSDLAKQNEMINQEIVNKLMSDKSGMEKTFGTERSLDKKETIARRVFGDKAVTVDELLNNKDKVKDFKIPGSEDDPIQFLERLKEIRDADESGRVGDLFVDRALRMNKDGEIYSVSNLTETVEKFENGFLHTLPGKLAKPLDFHVYTKNIPHINIFGIGTTDYKIPTLAENSKGTVIDNNYVRVYDKTYRLGENGLQHVSELDNTYLISGEHGITPRMYKNIMGDTDRIASNNPLGFGQNPKLSKKQKKAFEKAKKDNPDWIPNIFDRLEKGSYDITTYGDDYAEALGEYFADVRRIDDYYNKTSAAPTQKVLNKISKGLGDESLFKTYIDDYLMLEDDELLEKVMSDPFINSRLGNKGFLNQDLNVLLRSNSKDKVLIGTKTINGLTGPTNITHAQNYTDLLRRELFKEGIMEHYAGGTSKGGNAILRTLENADLTSTELDEVKSLSHWAIMQRSTSVFSSDIELSSIEKLTQSHLESRHLFANELIEDEHGKFFEDFKDNAKRIAEYRTANEILTDVDYRASIEKGHRPNKYIYMQKAITPMDIIGDLNDTTKAFETTQKFFKQFVAGRNNPEDITTATILPYFAAFRLTDALSDIKMSLSSDDTGSVLDITKNIALKYVAPAAIGLTALSYLNYESENLTGTSLKGMIANGVANVDLGFRKFADATHLTGLLQNAYVNPIAQYYFDKPFESYEERKDYYENGYDPVRKSRFWNFGSASEFIGGKIEYFAPNYVKRANTEWKDIGVYGSSEEKWKHSWMPTLRHPLAPINRLLDPYWLEEKNKYSRPYPITAPMFQDGMPFSGLLNATVGQVLKPQKMMHTDRLGKDFVDVKDLIEIQNKKIMSESKESKITLLGSNSFTERYDYTSDFIINNIPGSIAGQELEHTIKQEDNSNQYGYGQGQNGNDSNYKTGYNANTGSEFNSYQKAPILNPIERLLIKTASTSNSTAMSQIEKINQKVKGFEPGAVRTGMIQQAEQAKAQTHIDLLRDKDIAADIRSTTSNKQFLLDSAFSTKQLLGIYGFMADEILPDKQRYALAHAGQMHSFSRTFWDESIGGLGGNFMEIARRFFPHEDRDINRINPLRNNMPSWMPERFKHGDPYTLVKRGEMRLPGAAYETMNYLEVEPDFSIHGYMVGSSQDELYNYFLNKDKADEYLNTLPQQQVDITEKQAEKTLKDIDKVKERIYKEIDSGYLNKGQFYDDFTRFKILADVAPWSQEYKDYRDKLKHGLSPDQQKEFDATLDRVEKQSKTHRFFDYNFVGQDFKRETVHIDKVSNNGFTVVGSDKVYNLAGINASAQNISQKLMAGMEVTIEYDEKDKDEDQLNVVVHNGGSNINRELWKEKLATPEFDGTTMSTRALSTGTQRVLGFGAEILSHTQIPFIHNKFLKIETALESYENEQVYGTTFSSWSKPIDSILKPMFYKSQNIGALEATIGIGTLIAKQIIDSKTTPDSSLKTAANVATAMFTPGAFLGGSLGYGIKLSEDYMNKGAMIGTAVWAAGYAYTHASNPFTTTAIGAGLGALAAEFYDGKNVKGIGKTGALIGSAVGLAWSAYRTNGFDRDKIFKKWIPKRTKERWELEEYYDRLEYIKYKGLFEKSAREALDKEGVDIKRLILEMEEKEANQEKLIEKTTKSKNQLLSSGLTNTLYGKKLLSKIDNTLNQAISPVEIDGGEYTKSALAYKQAMDSTIYGLKEGATFGQIMRALPKNDKEYFLEFSKVKDKKKRKEILKNISPYKQKILNELWGEKPVKLESNEKYFRDKYLPTANWRGWDADTDLDSYKVRTIENEGLLLADFGFYESELENIDVKDASPVMYEKEQPALVMRTNLLSALNGLGLSDVDVSIMPSEKSGIQVITDFVSVSNYEIKQGVNNLFGRSNY